MYQKTEGNSEANIITRLRENKEVDLENEELDDEEELDEAGFESNGSTYKYAFGRYSKDGESISADDYHKAREEMDKTGGSSKGNSEDNKSPKSKGIYNKSKASKPKKGGKKDTSYTANSQQKKADKDIRENPNYVGNDEVYKLLGGKDKVDYFKFITPISTHGNINSKDDITIEYGDVYHNDKGERRVSTTTTTFYADKIIKSGRTKES